MRVLVTNDDGVHAPGLWRMVESLTDLASVYVVAPDRDSSGVGTAMTLLSVVRVQEFAPPVVGVEAHSVQGTPSDCVILATESLFDEPFDLLVSGINPGANIGLDFLSSGTVGAALQGYYRGIPSLAVSAAYKTDTPVRYEAAARTGRALAEHILDGRTSGPLFLNVNLPDGDPDGIRGVEITKLGPRAYLENVEREQVGRRSHYWIRHDRPPTEEPGEGTDVWAVRNGRVSITPIDLVLTDEVDSAPLRSLTESVRSVLRIE